jgi:hypothetical protein
MLAVLLFREWEEVPYLSGGLTMHTTGGRPSACGIKQDWNPALQCMCRVRPPAHLCTLP